MASEGDDQEHSITEAFLSGIDVSLKLGQNAPQFPRRVEVLIEMVEKSLAAGGGKYQIFVHPRNYQAKTFLGSVEAYPERADIYYDRDQNLCWRRFILTKELCHLLFATSGEKHLASSPDEVEKLLVQILAGLENIRILKDHKAATEQCTILMAIEILLPHSERNKIKAQMEKGATALGVATEYRLPASMVSLYLEEDYADMMNEAYEAAGLPRTDK